MIIFSARISSDSISKKWTNKHFPKEFEFFKQRKNYHHFELQDFIFRLLCFSQDKGNTSMKKFVLWLYFWWFVFCSENTTDSVVFFVFVVVFCIQPDSNQKKKNWARAQDPQKNLNLPFQRVWIFLFSKIVSPLAHKKKNKFWQWVSLFLSNFVVLFSFFWILSFPHFFSFCLNKQKLKSTIDNFNNPPFFITSFCSWNVDMNVQTFPLQTVLSVVRDIVWIGLFCPCFVFVCCLFFDFPMIVFFLRTNNHEPYCWSTHKSTTTKKQEEQINDENNLICYSFVHFLIWS